MLKYFFIFFLSSQCFGITYTFSNTGATPLNFGSVATGVTANTPTVIGTTLCTTLSNTAGVLKVRLNAAGLNPYVPVTVSWTKPATLVNGPNSIPVTIFMGFCARNNAGTVVGGAGGLVSPYSFTPGFKNAAGRYWFYARGTINVPIGTPLGLYTGSVNFTGLY